MKTSTKIITAAFLALTAVAPAFAAEEDTLLERNTYAVHQTFSARAHRAVDAMAYVPASVEKQDYGIASQR